MNPWPPAILWIRIHESGSNLFGPNAKQAIYQLIYRPIASGTSDGLVERGKPEGIPTNLPAHEGADATEWDVGKRNCKAIPACLPAHCECERTCATERWRGKRRKGGEERRRGNVGGGGDGGTEERRETEKTHPVFIPAGRSRGAPGSGSSLRVWGGDILP